MEASPKGLIGFTKCFGLAFASSDHSVADSGGVISARLTPSLLASFVTSSSALLVFLVLARQPRMALTKCCGSLLTEVSDSTRLRKLIKLVKMSELDLSAGL